MTSAPRLNIDALMRSVHAQRLVETHISWVLLCEGLAYKLKKPVTLGFVDFSTMDARREACREELRLNRRLAPSLYLDVVPVFGTPDAPTFDGPGALIDHAVRMRRFADGALFSELLADGHLTAAMVGQLGRRVADFHRDAAVADESCGWGTPQRMVAAIEQVLDGLAAAGETSSLDELRDWLELQAVQLQGTWLSRLHTGRVRECHGDLHLANAVVCDGQALAFDGIDFDPALRWIDVMSDVAFMWMDLAAHGRRDLAACFLDAWLERSGDHAGLAVLGHAVVVRALVRALVAKLRPRPVPSPEYLAFARSQACSGQPRLMITHGFSGSGKTHLTQRLLERSAAIRVRSDVERKRLFGLQAQEASSAFPSDEVYGPDATRRTFASLQERAGAALRAGYPTIVDACFLRRCERDAFQQLAGRLNVPFAILHCHAGPALLRERIEGRLATGRDASEADVAVLHRQLADHDPLQDDELRHVIETDTTAEVDADALCARWQAVGPPAD